MNLKIPGWSLFVITSSKSSESHTETEANGRDLNPEIKKLICGYSSYCGERIKGGENTSLTIIALLNVSKKADKTSR